MTPRSTRSFLFTACALAAGLLLARPAGATPARAFVAPADRGVAADVARIRGVRDFDRLSPDHTVQIGLLMRVRNQAELEKLILAQGDRTSRYYHHFLTPAQFNAYFAPTPQSYAATMALLARRGFTVTQTLQNRSMIRATASAATVERYFHTELHHVFQTGHGDRYVNVTPAVMPSELRNVAVSVSGLHDVVTVQFPIHFGDPAKIRSSRAYAANRALLAAGLHPRPQPHPNATAPGPIATSTPGVPAPGPDPTETAGDTLTEYAEYYGYDPTIYMLGYDYPVKHGYGGSGFSVGSVISADYLDSDAAMEFSSFNIDRTGTATRVCTDPNPAPKCDGLIGAGDSEGESTLDALTIMSLAPQANFYEYLNDNLNDIGIEFAYETAINQDIVSVLNSSFGGCETSDPAFEYSSNYIAMEGSALGITFSASSGDNGAFECGIYATNGAPQTEKNVFVPSADDYFTGVGGTSYLLVTPASTNDYTAENNWLSSGGGFSQYEPIPSWQTALVAQSSPLADASTTNRNVPDVAFCADPGTNPDGFVGGVDGVSELIVHNGTITPGGGTSLASPMWVAMQTEIDQVQGSRNGFVNPSLYAIAATSSAEYDFAFHDITAGPTNVGYIATTGYDLTTGIGSVLGWELAGAAEYGSPSSATAAFTHRSHL